MRGNNVLLCHKRVVPTRRCCRGVPLQGLAQHLLKEKPLSKSHYKNSFDFLKDPPCYLRIEDNKETINQKKDEPIRFSLRSSAHSTFVRPRSLVQTTPGWSKMLRPATLNRSNVSFASIGLPSAGMPNTPVAIRTRQRISARKPVSKPFNAWPVLWPVAASARGFLPSSTTKQRIGEEISRKLVRGPRKLTFI